MERNQRNSKYHQRQKKEEAFDTNVITKYLILTIVFAFIAYIVEVVVIKACNQSPTGKCGNGILSLFEVHNTGAAFGLFPDQTAFIIIASFIALIAMLVFVLFFSGKITPAGSSALAVLSGGILMNLVERINLGYVIDYIHCEFAPQIPVFNIPDVMILVGAVCLVLSVFSKR